MAGPAPREALAWRLELPAADFERPSDLRVALMPTDELAPVAAEVAERVTMVGAVLEKAGATVSYEARPDFDLAAGDRNYQSLLNAVMTGAMTNEAEARMLEVVDGLDPDDVSRDAVAARAAVMRHREWTRTNTRREKLRRAWARFFEDWDILVCPQMATTAFPHDHRPFARAPSTSTAMSSRTFSTAMAGMVVNAYLPSTVFRDGPSTDGLRSVCRPSAPLSRPPHDRVRGADMREIGGFRPTPGYDGRGCWTTRRPSRTQLLI